MYGSTSGLTLYPIGSSAFPPPQTIMPPIPSQQNITRKRKRENDHNIIFHKINGLLKNKNFVKTLPYKTIKEIETGDYTKVEPIILKAYDEFQEQTLSTRRNSQIEYKNDDFMGYIIAISNALYEGPSTRNPTHRLNFKKMFQGNTSTISPNFLKSLLTRQSSVLSVVVNSKKKHSETFSILLDDTGNTYFTSQELIDFTPTEGRQAGQKVCYTQYESELLSFIRQYRRSSTGNPYKLEIQFMAEGKEGLIRSVIALQVYKQVNDTLIDNSVIEAKHNVSLAITNGVKSIVMGNTTIDPIILDLMIQINAGTARETVFDKCITKIADIIRNQQPNSDTIVLYDEIPGPHHNVRSTVSSLLTSTTSIPQNVPTLQCSTWASYLTHFQIITNDTHKKQLAVFVPAEQVKYSGGIKTYLDPIVQAFTDHRTKPETMFKHFNDAIVKITAENIKIIKKKEYHTIGYSLMKQAFFKITGRGGRRTRRHNRRQSKRFNRPRRYSVKNRHYL